MKGLGSICRALLVLFWWSTGSVMAQAPGSISGRVVDDSTSAPLVGANIVLEGSRRGTATDSSGRFSFPRVPPGSHTLRVTYIGYGEVFRPIRVAAGEAAELEIRLKRVVLTMPEVLVTASRQSYIELSLQSQPSAVSFSPRDIQRVPTVGEPDLFRALQILPGITAPNQASNQLYIRGGSPDQNLVRIDGATIYNPFHLFGLAANVNPDLVGRVTVSTGGFPARYGDRLSGVVDIETRQVAAPFVAAGSVSLLSSKILLGGRPSPGFQWLLSGRRSYHDWAAKLLGYELPYHFYDVFGKVTWMPNRHHLFRFSTFYSEDVLFSSTTDSIPVWKESDGQPAQRAGWLIHKQRDGFPWNNLAANLAWEYSPSMNWVTELAVNWSRTGNTGISEDRYRVTGGVPEEVAEYYRRLNEVEWSVSNLLTDLSISGSVLWGPNQRLRVQGGADFSQVRLDYNWKGIDNEGSDIVLFFDNFPPTFGFRSDYRRQGLFVEALWTPRSGLRLQPSLRADWRSHTGSVTLDPRLSLTVDVTPVLRLQGAVGRYHQGMAFLREQGIFAINELYFPLSFTSAATHGVVGLAYEPNATTRVKIEAYYKDFDRQALSVGPGPDVVAADGWAYGLEATVQRGAWQASYVFARVRRRFDGLIYDTPWDIRHRFQVIGQMNLGKRWQLNLRWELHTGQPYSPLDLEQLVPAVHYNTGTGRLEYGYEKRAINYPKGAIRYPIYHRLDLTLVRRPGGRGWSISPFFQILNVYNRRNPLFFTEDFRYSPDPIGDYQRVLTPITVPILPTVGVRFAF
jgi:hypothetical protein